MEAARSRFRWEDHAARRQSLDSLLEIVDERTARLEGAQRSLVLSALGLVDLCSLFVQPLPLPNLGGKCEGQTARSKCGQDASNEERPIGP